MAQQKKIQFRDKNDLVTLPTIPSELVKQAGQLLGRLATESAGAVSKLNKIYKFMDSYNQFVDSFAVCQKGCSHCCKMDVEITEVEAEYIQKNTGTKISHGTSVTRNHHSSCPFLSEEGACRIYEHRPYNCRTFHTLDDPKYCIDGIEDHQTYGNAGHGYGSGIMISMATVIRDLNGKKTTRDIRDFFGN